MHCVQELKCDFCTNILLDGKTFSRLILWSYTRATEWCLNHGNWMKRTKTYHFLCEALFRAHANGMHENELIAISGLWDLKEKKVEELPYLLVFVRSPRSEG